VVRPDSPIRTRDLREFQDPDRLPPAPDVCAYADGSWSFLRNRDYLEIDHSNCADFDLGPEFFATSDDAVITDRAGLREGLILAIAFYWGSKQQYLYLWDELIWVLGFLVIDRNIRDWRSRKRSASGRTFSVSPPAV
jgi:hypothetical protein